MRNKFLGTGQQGFHPIRKMHNALSSVRYAILYDFAVAYKILLSIIALVGCLYYRQWLDFSLGASRKQENLKTILRLPMLGFKLTTRLECSFHHWLYQHEVQSPNLS